MILKKKVKDTNIFLTVQKWFHTFSLAKSFVIDFSVIFLGNHLYILSINTVSLSSEFWGEKGRCTLMVVLVKKHRVFEVGRILISSNPTPFLQTRRQRGGRGWSCHVAQRGQPGPGGLPVPTAEQAKLGHRRGETSPPPPAPKPVNLVQTREQW